MRVAIAQFSTSLNTQENLAKCLRIIKEAATCRPELLVLPEYCNTLPCYSNFELAWQQALTVDGEFFEKIAEQAKEHNCFIVFNATVQRDGNTQVQGGANTGDITVTSCLFSPEGELVLQSNKQNLNTNEQSFFVTGTAVQAPVNTEFESVGLIVGDDSQHYRAARELAMQGAKLQCNSLSNFSSDHFDLYGAVNACENAVFFASANKIGPLVSPSFDEEERSNRTISVPKEFLVGSGHSQIVAPSGEVLASLAHRDEGFTYADINLLNTDVGFEHKKRPDGTVINQQRREELYLTMKKGERCENINSPEFSDKSKVPETANVAIFATYTADEQAIEDVCFYIENNLSDIIQLPELFFVADKLTLADETKRRQIEQISLQAIDKISAALRPFQYVCTSLLIDGNHQAVLIGDAGVLAKQAQLHYCARYAWTMLSNRLDVVNVVLEQGIISIAMLTADDANIPELMELAAAKGAQLVLAPIDIQEPSEVKYSLLSRAAENRICIVAATREKSFKPSVHQYSANNEVASKTRENQGNKKRVKAEKSAGLIANLAKESTLTAQLKMRKFKGNINQPIVKRQFGKITKSLVYPAQACLKELSLKG